MERQERNVAPKMKYVFGPVPSRRLGQSLGIDTIPLKTCNWNCVYCQLGRTVPLTNVRRSYFPMGAFTVMTGVLYPAAFFLWTGLGALTALFGIWLVVTWRTILGAWQGSIFRSHQVKS